MDFKQYNKLSLLNEKSIFEDTANTY